MPELDEQCHETSEEMVQEHCTAQAAADLMETALAIHSSNPPRNGSQKHYTITISIILLLPNPNAGTH